GQVDGVRERAVVARDDDRARLGNVRDPGDGGTVRGLDRAAEDGPHRPVPDAVLVIQAAGQHTGSRSGLVGLLPGDLHRRAHRLLRLLVRGVIRVVTHDVAVVLPCAGPVHGRCR